MAILYTVSVSVIVMLLTFVVVLVSFLFAACNQFGCYVQ
jgi:predicted small secreted protein